jgi:hypothetical protein
MTFGNNYSCMVSPLYVVSYVFSENFYIKNTSGNCYNKMVSPLYVLQYVFSDNSL